MNIKFEQFIYTDNAHGHGLSVFAASEGLSSKFLSLAGQYCSYDVRRENTPALRYNTSFSGTPMLIKTSFIGDDVTSGRKGNFVSHALVASSGPLNYYPVDYFKTGSRFCSTVSVQKARSPEPQAPLKPQMDTVTNPTDTMEDLDRVLKCVNGNPDFYKALVQSVFFSLEDINVYVGLYDMPDPVLAVRAVSYMFTPELAAAITFNTRAFNYVYPSTLYIDVNGNGKNVSATYGSVEIMQFYQSGYGGASGECRYVFTQNSQPVFGQYLPFIEWLFRGGVTRPKLVAFHRMIREGGYGKITDLERFDPDKAAPLMAAAKPAEAPAGAAGAVIDRKHSKKPKKEKGKKAPRTRGEGEITQTSGTAAKRSKKPVIIICALVLVLLLAVIMIIINFGEKGPSGPPANTTVTFRLEDGTEREYTLGSELNLPLPEGKWGYEFECYTDPSGNSVTDQNGLVLNSYSPDTTAGINVTAKWRAVSNTVTIDYGRDEHTSVTCLTDQSIVIPDASLNAVKSAYPHMQITALKLKKDGKTVCTVGEDGSLAWTEGFNMLSEKNYGLYMDQNNTLELVPATEYIKYPVIFLRYGSGEELGRQNISYDGTITVPAEYYSRFNAYSVYLAYSEGAQTKYSKVYDPSSDGHWTGGRDKVSGYEAELNAKGRIELYVAGAVSVKIDGADYMVDYLSDIFAFCQSKVDGGEVNCLYCSATGMATVRVDDNGNFWPQIDSRLKDVITLAPAFTRTVKYYNTLAEGAMALRGSYGEYSSNVTYRYFTSQIEVTGGENPQDVSLGANANITAGGATLASAVPGKWIIKSQSELDGAGYTVFDNYILQTGSGDQYVFDGEFTGGEFIFSQPDADGAVRLYAVYSPMELNIVFYGDETMSSGNVVYRQPWRYGDDPGWAALSAQGAVHGFTAGWGRRFDGWQSGTTSLQSLVSSGKGGSADVLSGMSVENKEVRFIPLTTAYRFTFVFNYGNKAYRQSNSYYAGQELVWPQAELTNLYPADEYDGVWSEGWKLSGGGNVTVDGNGRTRIDQSNFAGVSFGSTADVTVNLYRDAPAARQYGVQFSTETYTINNFNGDIEPSRDTISSIAPARIVFGGTNRLTVPDKGGFLSAKFKGWYYMQDGEFTAISDSTGYISDQNFKKLYALSGGAQTITLYAVFGY